MKYAMLVNYETEVVDVVGFDPDNENPMWNRGESWTWTETCQSYDEAVEESNKIDFSATVYRLADSDPSDEKNYRIVPGNQHKDITNDWELWFPKAHFNFESLARDYVKSSVAWVKWNLQGGKEAYLASLPSRDISNTSEEQLSDEELLGQITLDKLKR